MLFDHKLAIAYITLLQVTKVMGEIYFQLEKQTLVPHFVEDLQYIEKDNIAVLFLFQYLAYYTLLWTTFSEPVFDAEGQISSTLRTIGNLFHKFSHVISSRPTSIIHSFHSTFKNISQQFLMSIDVSNPHVSVYFHLPKCELSHSSQSYFVADRSSNTSSTFFVNTTIQIFLFPLPQVSKFCFRKIIRSI